MAGPDDDGFAFGVDSGTGCFVDLLAVSPDLPIGAWKATTVRGDWSTPINPMVDPSSGLAVTDHDSLIEGLFTNGRESVWFARLMEAPRFRRAVADEDWWSDNVFESGRDDAWYSRFDDPTRLGKHVANVSLPRATDGANFVIFSTGWGDGHYAVVGGYDANDDLVRVHIDFQIVNPPKPFWLGRPPGYDDDSPNDENTDGTT